VETDAHAVWLSVRVGGDATYAYAYSLDGKEFKEIGPRHKAEPGVWIGAKVGLFCLSPSIMNTKGYADFDLFRVE